jgi:AAA family ATP:ADP antiporter
MAEDTPVLAEGGRVATLVQRAVVLRPGELPVLLWAFAYFFALLCAYYILRPLREEMGIAGGVENLQWLFTGTFLVMLAAVPAFGALVARLPRRRFVPLVYHFFAANLLVFYLLLELDIATLWVARGFYVWVSVFNLFVVSVFWSFMADIFTNAQARRLFGFIAAGGSAGALLGPTLTASLAVPLGPVPLLLVSAAVLELAVFCVYRLLRTTDGGVTIAFGDGERGRTPPSGSGDTTAAYRTGGGEAAEPVIGGGLLAGITLVLRSPYLLGVAGYILLFTTTSTFLYFQQAHIVAGAFDDPAERTRLFAVIDLVVALLTIAVQCLATGRLMTRFGVGALLAVLPVLTLLGFLALAAVPTLVVLVAFQSTRRAANFALSKPAREVLFTVVGREQRYKAKNVLDTLVYRGGDAASGWAFAGLTGLGLGLSAIALVTLPVAALWLLLGLALGRAQDRRAAAPAADAV